MQPSRELQLGRRGQLGREADRVVDGDRLDRRGADVGHVVLGAAGVGARVVQQHHRLGGRDGLADPQHLAREVEPAAQMQRDARERYRRNRALLLALVREPLQKAGHGLGRELEEVVEVRAHRATPARGR